MNKLSFYILLILSYLGLSQTFTLTETGTKYIKNKESIYNVFDGEPICLILVDQFETGFLIKTYYQKYKVFSNLKQPQIVTVRTSKEFIDQNSKNIGMSLFRKDDENGRSSTVPLPPGSLFLGKPAYGTWEMDDSGLKVWQFHRAYKYFVNIFGWGSWRPTLEYYQKMKIFLDEERAFYGENNEFGTFGAVTKKNFGAFFNHKKEKRLNLLDYFKKVYREEPLSVQRGQDNQ